MEYIDEKYLRISKMSTIQLELTNYCNLQCVYCCGEMRNVKYIKNVVENHKKIDTSLAIKIAKQAADFGCQNATFLGCAEPTVHPNWQKIVSAFQDEGMKTSIISNLAKDYTDEEILTFAKMTQIWVSIDTAEPTIFALLRKGLTLDRLIKNLTRIVTCTKQINTSPVIVGSAVMCDRTIFSVESLFSLLESIGIHTLGLMPLIKMRDGDPLRDHKPMLLSDGTVLRGLEELSFAEIEKARGIIQYLRTKSDSSSLNLYMMPSLALCLGQTISVVSPTLHQTTVRCCKKLYDTAYIDCAGNMLECNTGSYTSKPLGNISEITLKEAYNNPRMFKLRKNSLRGKMSKICLRCCQYTQFSSTDEFFHSILPYIESY